MTFYLKYRPQTLKDLIGQEHIKLILKKAFENNKLSHAYLFCGPRGTGKTSTARILAKMVNCEKSTVYGLQTTEVGSRKSEDIPCNKCNSCISITDGSSLDLIEIDAASNRGIDDIRSLRETIKLSPISSKKKVYIIDEVHMLTAEAFNALLKTLEEPPQHVLFILATTEANKIPQTILSRVQKFDFKLAPDSDLEQVIKKVVKIEKIDIEDDAIKIVAKKAEGSFRDSLKILDQLASQEEKITTEKVDELVKSGSFTLVLNLLDTITKKNTKSALEQIGDLEQSGVNFKELNLAILDTLRTMLLVKHNSDRGVKESLSEEKYNLLLELTKKLSNDQLLNLLNNFLTSLEKLKFVSIPALPLEIAVVESSQESLQTTVYGLQPKEEITVVGSQKTVEIKTDAIVESPAMAAVAEPSTTTDDAVTADMAKLLDKWTYILETVKPYNYSLEALLRQVKIVSCEGGNVLLEVPYSFHQRILEAPKSRNLLESVLSDVMDGPTKVSCQLGKRPVKVEELANVELAADDEIIRVAAEIFNSEGVN